MVSRTSKLNNYPMGAAILQCNVTFAMGVCDIERNIFDSFRESPVLYYSFITDNKTSVKSVKLGMTL